MTIQEMIARQQAIVDGARKEGRGLTREEQTEFDQIQGKIDAARNAGGQDGNQGGGEPPAEGNRGAGNPGGAEGEGGNDDAARQAAVQAERQRNSDIVALCRQVGMDPAEYIPRRPDHGPGAPGGGGVYDRPTTAPWAPGPMTARAMSSATRRWTPCCCVPVCL